MIYFIYITFSGYSCKPVQDNRKVVNEHYPGDCLHFGRILDTTQPVYEVPGKPAAVKEPSLGERAGVCESGMNQEDRESLHSLQIKPVNGVVQIIGETQQRYEFSKEIPCLDVVWLVGVLIGEI